MVMRQETEYDTRPAWQRLLRIAFAALVIGALVGCSDDDDSDRLAVPNPAVEGPITGPGTPFANTTTFDPASVGYRQDEYFISGIATAWVNTRELTPDGNWDVARADGANYVTRVLVYRPIDASRFNGTVVMEWLNVTAGLDVATDWLLAHTHALRAGYAWVLVSAQRVGVEGNPGSLVNLGLKVVNPARYGRLSHPGDSFSYDMFSQAAQAVRNPAGLDLLDGLRVERLIAMGESQSAARLLSYVNAFGNRVPLFDAYLIHSRYQGSAPLSQAPQPDIRPPSVVRVREDLRVPVMMVQTETDLLAIGAYESRQDDTDRFRLWEIAGAAHADTYTAITSASDVGNDPSVVNVLVTASPVPGIIDCDYPINSGPQHFVLKAALAGLEQWVRSGEPPASAPRLEVEGDPLRIARDALGIARGGIRTHYVDAPIATLSGEGQQGSGFCRLFGTTAPFDAARLAELYPTPDAFTMAVAESTDRAVADGFLLPEDAALITAWAESYAIPSP